MIAPPFVSGQPGMKSSGAVPLVKPTPVHPSRRFLSIRTRALQARMGKWGAHPQDPPTDNLHLEISCVEIVMDGLPRQPMQQRMDHSTTAHGHSNFISAFQVILNCNGGNVGLHLARSSRLGSGFPVHHYAGLRIGSGTQTPLKRCSIEILICTYNYFERDMGTVWCPSVTTYVPYDITSAPEDKNSETTSTWPPNTAAWSGAP